MIQRYQFGRQFTLKGGRVESNWQNAQQGNSVFGSCKSTINSEEHVYRAQDRYLGENGEEYRIGFIFRFCRCEDSENPAIPLAKFPQSASGFGSGWFRIQGPG